MKNTKKSTLTQHLIEFRQRLMFSLLILLTFSVISYLFVTDIYNFLLEPLAKIYNGELGKKIIYTNPAEAFLTYIKLSFLSGVFFSFPFIALEIYLFLAPGLYRKERKFILSIFVFVPLLFLSGAAMLYYFILPLAFRFFLSFEKINQSTISIEMQARISEYLDLVIGLIFSFGIAFQLPILLIVLVKTGALTVESLRQKRKYWIVIIFTIAAVVTPPDVISQISLAIPMYLLYEIAILIGSRITANNK